ncbi:MAG: DNA mismatch endonuclease Vsr [Candidatus Sumerlaeia bacterium]|nr:DNA mismatch endonuclease Vsr [Candidatus Sumerlaeia bacterium]
MADVVSSGVRSRMMSGIRGKDTKPELFLRQALHRMGHRYRLHVTRLPGRPDLVFPSRSAVIFVNGCFWHGHDCHLFRWPSTRREFWRTKIERNRQHDREVRRRLVASGWRVLTVWECALKGRLRLSDKTAIERVTRWLDAGTRSAQVHGRRR